MSEQEERILALARLVAQRYNEEQAARTAWLDLVREPRWSGAQQDAYRERCQAHDRTEDAVHLLARLVRSLDAASATTEEVTE